jgi:quinol monooxygenase YgiN
MYGTIVRYQPKSGQNEAILADAKRWIQECAASTGFIGEYVLIPDDKPGEFIALAIFESEERYRANAADPEQDRWYQELRTKLVADPEWTDGPIIALEPASVPL